MQKWEYQTWQVDNSGTVWRVDAKPLRPMLELVEALSKAGQVGWELAGIAVFNAGDGTTQRALYTFKRPKE